MTTCPHTKMTDLSESFILMAKFCFANICSSCWLVKRSFAIRKSLSNNKDAGLEIPKMVARKVRVSQAIMCQKETYSVFVYIYIYILSFRIQASDIHLGNFVVASIHSNPILFKSLTSHPTFWCVAHSLTTLMVRSVWLLFLRVATGCCHALASVYRFIRISAPLASHRQQCCVKCKKCMA